MEETSGAISDGPGGSSLRQLLGSIESLLGWSLGQVRVAGSPPQLPSVCLEHCLKGSPEGLASAGCPWLRRMVQAEEAPPLPPGGRCERGFQIHPPSRGRRREAGRIFALGDRPRGWPEEPGLADQELAGLWEGVLNSVEEVVRDFTCREEENVRLVEEVLQSYEQLNILFEVTKASVSMARPEEMYDFALNRLSTALRAHYACFYNSECHFDRTIPRFIQQAGPYRAYRDLISGDAREAIQEVVGSGAAQTLEISKPQAEQAQLHCGSLLVVPLVSGQESLGAAVFGRPPTEPFHTGDRSMAEAVMGQVAITAHKMRLFQDLQQMSFDVVGALVNAIDAKDKYTCGHSDRVARWSVKLGQALQVTEEDLQMLAWGGRLHDVGKIGVRDDVLGKPGRLTEEEFAHIKKHPVVSYEVLKPIHRLAHVLKGVRHHHEAWDGSGYPDGLTGEEIPLEARIIQTADVFDALTSSRSYRSAYSVEKALSIMQESAGTRHDPNLVQLFVQVVQRARVESPDLFEHIPRHDEAPALPKGGVRG